MSEIQFLITGPSNETFESIEEMAPNVRQAIRQTFFYMGRELKKSTSKDILDKATKTGRVYVRRTKSGRKRRHQASAPGETHANMSGNLRKSLGWKVHGTDYLEFGYGVTKWSGRASDYAARIEFGGTDSRGITIEARPSIQNNIEGAKFETFFAQALEKLVG